MSTSRLDYFLDLGKSHNLSGTELLTFARQMVNEEREERAKEREQKVNEMKLLKEREELERQKKEFEARLESDRLKLLHQQEIEKVAMQKEQESIEHARQMDLRRLELERLQIENEAKLRQEEIAVRRQESVNVASDSNTSLVNQNTNWFGRRFDLGIGLFDNNPENLDAFVNRFEAIAKSYELPTKLWAIEFSKALQGTSLQTYELLDTESKMDYDCLIQALRKRHGITEGSYRKLFRNSRPDKNERLSDFVLRLRHYLKSWLDKSHLPATYDGLFELIVSQAFYQSLDKPVQTFLRENGRMSLEELIIKAQNYVDAHPSFDRTKPNTGKNGQNFKGNKSRDDDKEAKASGQSAINSGPKGQNSFSNERGPKVKCFRCGKIGHKSFDCKQQNVNRDATIPKSAACQTIDNNSTNGRADKVIGGDDIFPTVAVACDRNQEIFLRDLKYPFKGKALIDGQSVNYMRDTGSTLTIVQDRFVKNDQFTGNKISVLLADRCVRYLPEAKVHISCPCFTGDIKVLVMENPVYPLIIGNNVYQNDDSSDGITATDDDDTDYHPVVKTMIFDNSMRVKPHSRFEENEIQAIDKPETTKSCLSKAEFGGNVDHRSHGTEIVNAVQTRAQAKAESKSIRSLKHTKIDALNLSPVEFKKMQQEDQTLKKYWDLAKLEVTDDDQKAKFLIKDDVLYREYKSGPNDDIIEQIVVPKCLSERVILYAHETSLSGHMGINATYKKLCTNFFIPGAMNQCRRLILSCLLCQQGANRSAGSKAPLQSLPIISEPFHTVYIDLVGKIEPSSADGHSYILTLIDNATHFATAVALKRTDSVTIAEALMKQFDLVGYPRYIYSDNGSNLSSEILKEIYKTFGIDMKNTPVYWPRANLVERQHAVIKMIMRKLVNEQPRQWHRYLDALMFAIRTTPNASGYSPFELLFGRQARTHLTFLKELWSGRNDDPEVKTTYQYVLDLQNRIAETCEFAQNELSKVRDRNFKYFNRNAKLRKFKPNDKVWVLNTKTQGKFDFNWIGPAIVLERRGQVCYKIKFDNGHERLYHINMLKPFVSREKTQFVDQTNKSLNSDTDVVDSEAELDDIGISAAVMGLVEDSDCDDDVCSDVNSIRLEEQAGKIEIANVEQTETWKDVKVNPQLSKDEQRIIWDLVEEYSDIFSDVPTPTNLVTYDIKLKSDEPIRQKPYKIPVHLVNTVEKELEKMLKLGWIERSDSPYASPMVIVKKRDSPEVRICVSYKRLNAITVIDPTPQPDMEDILAKLGSSKIFTSVDACKGFYAIKMEETAKKYTSFVTPRDSYCFNVCPFGLVNAPSVYARLTRKLLEGTTNVENFVDDILAHNSDFQGHLVTLKDLFDRVRKANIKLKPSKVRIGFSELTFLGQIVGNGTVRPTQENVEKIINAPIPRTKKGVRSLCGMVNWLRKFIPDAAKLLKPLNDLLSNRQSDIIAWGIEQQEAWDRIKIILTTQPVLSLYDPRKDHVLATDASNDFIGGTLLQREDDGELHPVMYASRKCQDRETRYDIQNKEMLAIVWCCSRFYRFIYGAPFTIQTDCCALSMLNGKLSNNPRVVRWQLYLQSFNFRVEIIRGKDNPVADYLSRQGT